MVECRLIPVLGGMAGGTVCPQLAFVGVILQMAGLAPDRGLLHSRHCRLSLVAALAGDPAVFHFGVPAFQLKCGAVVIKGFPVGIHPVVTGAAVRPKSQPVIRHND